MLFSPTEWLRRHAAWVVDGRLAADLVQGQALFAIPRSGQAGRMVTLQKFYIESKQS
jgi:hypothetical protein